MAPIVSFSTVHDRNECWRNAQVEAFYVKCSTHSNLYAWDMSTYPSSLCFSNTHWLLWKCQRPHQKPLLLWCVVAGPSKAPHYWLMEPHQLHSIKTQRQPHAVVSPGLSELRLAETHWGRRLLTSTDTETDGAMQAEPPELTLLLTYFSKYVSDLPIKWCFIPHLKSLGLQFVLERFYTNKLVFYPSPTYRTWIINTLLQLPSNSLQWGLVVIWLVD